MAARLCQRCQPDSWCHYQRFLERKHSADLALTDAMVALTLARRRCNLHHLKCRKVKAYDMRLPGLFLILRVTAPLRTATYHVSYIFHYTVGQVSCMLWIWGCNACHAKHCLSCLQVDSSDTALELSRHFIRYFQ